MKILHPKVQEWLDNNEEERKAVLGRANDALSEISRCIGCPEDIAFHISVIGACLTVQLQADFYDLSDEECEERLEEVIRALNPVTQVPWLWAGSSPTTRICDANVILLNFVQEVCIAVPTSEMVPKMQRLCGEDALQHLEAQDAS